MKVNNEIGRIIIEWTSKGKGNNVMRRLTEVKIKVKEGVIMNVY